MKKLIALALSLLALPLTLLAQEHGGMLMTPEDIQAYAIANSHHGPVIPQPSAISATAAAKTFAITVKQFTFVISPGPFEVNQGDVVTLDITMPANDGAASHSMFIETYVPVALGFTRGQTKTVTFTATTVGTFQYACTIVSCGSGHNNMIGNFVVKPAANPAPVLNSITPTSGSTAGGTTVSISGGNIQPGATVRFGGTAATSVNVTSSSNLTLVTPAHAAGAVDVVLTNPDGQTSTLAGAFTYTTPASGFSITSVSPNEGPTSGNTLLTITGTGFLAGATVTVGGVPAFATNVISSTRITAQSPFGPASVQVDMARDVVVINPDGTRATATASFTYRVPELALLTITPARALTNGGSTIEISGAGMTVALASSITIGGVPATDLRVIDAITIAATVPAHAAGTVDVVLTVGGRSVTARNAFSYVTTIARRRATK